MAKNALRVSCSFGDLEDGRLLVVVVVSIDGPDDRSAAVEAVTIRDDDRLGDNDEDWRLGAIGGIVSAAGEVVSIGVIDFSSDRLTLSRSNVRSRSTDRPRPSRSQRPSLSNDARRPTSEPAASVPATVTRPPVDNDNGDSNVPRTETCLTDNWGLPRLFFLIASSMDGAWLRNERMSSSSKEGK